MATGSEEPFVPKPDTTYMEVPVCKLCLHWKEFPFTQEDLAICDRMSEMNETSMVRTILPPPRPLLTRSNFGCVLFEKKS